MPAMKRFTVSFEEDDYERLMSLAHDHKPKMSLGYVVQFAVRKLLESADDRQLRLELENPLPERSAYE